MGVDPTIVSLACQIAKLKQWGKAWERTAAAKKEEIVELRTKLSLEVESLREEIAGLRGIVKERDGLLTQVQDMRAEMERLRIEAAKCKAERDDLYQREGIGQKRRMDVEDERDALRAEVEFLKTLRPKYKVGDKLQLYPAIRYTPVTVVGVRTVYDCQADGAEYPVGHSEDELTERYEQTPPEATHAEPDLTQLHAKGKEAWSDVPNATQWVEEMRGNSEATHDTEAGKAAAASAVKTEPVAEEIKVGDMGEVFQATTRTLNSDVGITGCVSSIHLDPCHGGFLVKFDPSTQSRRSAGMQAFGLCDVRKVTT